MSSDRYAIEDLDTTHHHIDLFYCGEPQLDNILHHPVLLQGCGRTFVVVPHANSPEILACFTLNPRPKEVFSTEKYTYVQLNILAVDRRFQKQGIGRWILAQLFQYMVHRAETEKLDYLLVDPLNDEIREYYLALEIGFVQLPWGELILLVETMRQAVAAINYNTSPWFESNE